MKAEEVHIGMQVCCHVGPNEVGVHYGEVLTEPENIDGWYHVMVSGFPNPIPLYSINKQPNKQQ